MNRLYGACCLGLILIVIGAASPATRVDEVCLDPHLPGMVLVNWRTGETSAVTRSDLNSAPPLPSINTWRVRVPIGQECERVAEFRRDSRVAYAELDYAAHATDVVTPTDPGWAAQWGPRQIEAPAAWSMVTGTTGIIIAVVDSGIKLDHEDLVSQRWINSDEVPGNFVDDDGNGQIDDVNGWHFFHRYAGSGYVPDEDANVQDDYGHGTHVAGIVAAAANNGVGIAGSG